MKYSYEEITGLTGYSISKIKKDIQRGHLDDSDLNGFVGYLLRGMLSCGLEGLLDLRGAEMEIRNPPSSPVLIDEKVDKAEKKISSAPIERSISEEDQAGESEGAGSDFDGVPVDSIEPGVFSAMMGAGKNAAQARKIIMSMRVQVGEGIDGYLKQEHAEELGL